MKNSMDNIIKAFFITLSVLAFASCGKDNCQSCTRTWKYKSYTLLSTGAQTSIVYYDGGTESFKACGDDMIKAEEQTKTTYAKTPVPNYTNKWSVIEGTGTCDCQ